MKSKSLLDVAKTDSLALTAVITYWKDYDKNTVILSYLELKRRKFNIEPNVQKKLNDFSQKQGESIEQGIENFKKEKNIENYEDYYSEVKPIIDAENPKKEIVQKPIAENSSEQKSKTIFTPLNICLFLGLCIGCYLPIKYLLESSGGKKCSDIEATTTVLSLLEQKGLRIKSQNGQLKNIVTTAKNTELNSCGCEATLTGYYYNTIIGRMVENPMIYYDIKQTDDGEAVVTITTELH